MSIRIWAGIALLSFSAAALAQRPLVYPLRSQSGGTQAVDNAYCYWQATTHTGVNTARESQRPVRTQPIVFGADAAHGASEPPLPPAKGASAAVAASNSPRSAAGASATAESALASSSPAASGAAGSQPAQTASSAQLPPLPPPLPPEPPMTTYWRAYGDCMQARGYGVR